MFEAIEKMSSTNNWVTLFFMAVLILLSVLQFNFTDRFHKLFSLIYSEKYYTDFEKTRPLIFNWFHLLFFFVIIFNFSLLIYFSFDAFSEDKTQIDFLFYSKVLLVTVGYFLLRYITGVLLAFIFDLEEGQNYFTFLKMSNLSFMATLLFPFLVLTYYSVGVFHQIMLVLSIVAVIGVGLFSYFGLIKNEKLSFNHLFYLFLYLCALELAPFIVIYKLFVD